MSSQAGSGRVRRRRLLAIAGLIIVVLAVGVGLWLTLGHSTSSASPAPPPATIAPKNVGRLQAAINGKTVQAQALALQPELQAAFIQSDQLMLPAKTTVTIEASTFQGTDKTTGDYATVEAKTSSGLTYRLYLIKESGTWYLVYTEEVAQ